MDVYGSLFGRTRLEALECTCRHWLVYLDPSGGRYVHTPVAKQTTWRKRGQEAGLLAPVRSAGAWFNPLTTGRFGSDFKSV